MLLAAKILAANVKRLLPLGHPGGRPKLAEKIGIGDKTLGFIRGGNGNPTLESIEAVARHLRLPVWVLFQPEQPDASDATAWTATSASHGRLASTLLHCGPHLSPAAADAIEALVRELTTGAQAATDDHRARALTKVTAAFERRGTPPQGPLFENAVAELVAAYRRNEAIETADQFLDGLLNEAKGSQHA